MILREKSQIYYDKRIVETNGQTSFTLSKMPPKPETVVMFPMGGTELLNGTDFTVSGKTVTYVGTVSFVADEVVIFKYYR